jgi:hypothetical protein
MKATDRWDCSADELDFELALLSQSNPPVQFQSPPPMTEILAACLGISLRTVRAAVAEVRPSMEG